MPAVGQGRGCAQPFVLLAVCWSGLALVFRDVCVCDGAQGLPAPQCPPGPNPAAVGELQVSGVSQQAWLGYGRVRRVHAVRFLSDALRTGLVMGAARGWALVTVMELPQNGLARKRPLKAT